MYPRLRFGLVCGVLSTDMNNPGQAAERKRGNPARPANSSDRPFGLHRSRLTADRRRGSYKRGVASEKSCSPIARLASKMQDFRTEGSSMRIIK